MAIYVKEKTCPVAMCIDCSG